MLKENGMMIGGEIEGREYNNAAIVRIKMENFITYDSVELFPGPNLNVVIGPNGSGKSALVCGICLGLGGKPDLLGRARKTGEFVKNGKQQGFIEIELYQKNEANVVVRRELFVDNKNTWKLNGQVSNQTKVREQIAKLNIRIDNLCQFLPQDKVVDFAKLNAQQRLAQTQQSIGGEEMVENHQKLCEAQTFLQTASLNKEEEEKTITGLEERNASIEADVQKYKERESSKKEKEIMENKRAYVLYEMHRQEYIDAKENKTELEAKVAQKEEDFGPMKEKIVSLKKQCESVEKEKKQHFGKANKLTKKLSECDEVMTNLTDERGRIKDELDEKIKFERKKQNKIQEIKNNIADLEEQISTCDDGSSDDQKAELAVLKTKLRDLALELKRSKRKQEDLTRAVKDKEHDVRRAKDELQELDNKKNQVLGIVKAMSPDTYEAVQWLRNNKDKFEGEVFEPVITQLNLHNVKNAKFLESSLSQAQKISFVFQSMDDMKFFLKKVKDEMKLRVNTILAPKPKHCFNHPISHGELKKFGLECYISDLYDASETIKRALCDNSAHHLVPIGGPNVPKHNEELFKLGVKNYYSQDTCYKNTRSHYGDQGVSSLSYVVNDGKFLKDSVDPAERTALKKELEKAEANKEKVMNELEKIKEEVSSIEVHVETAEKRKEELKEMVDRKSRLEQKIAISQSRLASYLNNPFDLENEKHLADKRSQEINHDRLKEAVRIKDLIMEVNAATHDAALLTFSLGALQKQKVTAEQQSTDTQQEIAAGKQEVKKLERIVRESKEAARKSITEAKSRCDINDAAIKRVFALYPDTLEELNQSIAEKDALIDCNYSTDAKLVQDYNAREKDIERRKANLAKLQNTYSSALVNMESMKEAWLVPLQLMVTKITEKFENFFRKMDCAGEVCILESEKYENYGIDIKVNFRSEEDLQVLDQYRQSGGERSVSTMLYLMAMQAVNRCPFRVVDEINQGMDPINERRVFGIISETATQEGTSQYFLITPKLLPSLNFSEHMTVLCVFNGDNMVDHAHWDVRSFLQKRRNLVAAA